MKFSELYKRIDFLARRYKKRFHMTNRVTRLKTMKLADFEYLTINRNYQINSDNEHPLICPKGTKVKFIYVVKTCYGTWFVVEYNGNKYNIRPEYCDGNVIVETKYESYSSVEKMDTVSLLFLTDRYGKQYVMNENGEINPL